MAQLGLRMLVVDDSPVNRELIRALLDPLAPDIEEAADGAAAIEAAAREAFDLVLMDLQMPGIDGLMAAKAIRAGAGPNRDTPIVAVSASARPDDVAACGEAGMNDHVPKPLSAGDLLSKVARWARRPAD